VVAAVGPFHPRTDTGARVRAELIVHVQLHTLYALQYKTTRIVWCARTNQIRDALLSLLLSLRGRISESARPPPARVQWCRVVPYTHLPTFSTGESSARETVRDRYYASRVSRNRNDKLGRGRHVWRRADGQTLREITIRKPDRKKKETDRTTTTAVDSGESGKYSSCWG